MNFLVGLINAVSIFGILTIFLILIIRSRKRIHVYFSIFCLIASFWLGTQVVAQFFFSNHDLGLIRLSAALSNLLPLLFLAFVRTYANTPRMNSLVKTGSILLAALLALCNLTSLGIQEVTAKPEGISIEKAGVFYQLGSVFTTTVFVYCLVKLIHFSRMKRNNVAQKQASILLSWGLGFALISSLLAAVVFATVAVAQLLIPVSFLVLASVVYYAIAKHRLFDLRLIFARTLAYLLVVSLLAAAYGTMLMLVSRFIQGQSFDKSRLLIDIILTLILGLTFIPAKKFFDRLTNRLFYRDAYDPQVFLDGLSNILVSTIDLSKLLHDSADLISGTLKSSYIKFLLVDQGSSKSVRVIGHAVSMLDKSEAVDLTSFLDKVKQKVFVTEDESDTHSPERPIVELMKTHNIGVALRLVTHQQRVGYILVGIKQSGSPYTKQDIRLFEITADELSLAVQNALRFEEIENFNITLQKKVTDATKELKRSNEKLKALDEAKDEFISMASHQLRTPLTSVKGYVSMVLEGDAGKVSTQQKELLGQSYASAQRMVYLISDLLNVSRLKTGKFIIEPKPIYLPDVISEELEQVKEMASVKNIEIAYGKPPEFPTVDLDDTKIRQVIMNFIDNAIHYTPNGGRIVISLTHTERQVEFTVVDNGIGVPKSEQHHLFTKFYRAGNAKKARPDGTGLGLFMAKKVIVASGGALIFRSQEGKGSTFGFTFPLRSTT